MDEKIIGQLTIYYNSTGIPFKVFSIDNLELFLFEKPFFDNRSDRGSVCTKEYLTEKYITVGGWRKNNDLLEITINGLGIFIARPIVDLIYDYEVMALDKSNGLLKLAEKAVLATEVPTNTYLSTYILNNLFK